MNAVNDNRGGEARGAMDDITNLTAERPESCCERRGERHDVAHDGEGECEQGFIIVVG